MIKKQGRNHVGLILNPLYGDVLNVFDVLSLFKYLYENRWIKEDGFIQRLWYRLVKQRWYQISLIPMHVVKGCYYKYSKKEIYCFCINTLKTKDTKMAKTAQEYETVIKYLKMTVELQEHIIELQKEIIILGKAAEFPNCKITYTGFNPGV